jgi:putative endonuclease
MLKWLAQLFRSGDQASHLQSGRWGERQAVRFLKSNRFTILGERVRVGKRDEIDIVARHGNVVVFVEVKTRRNEQYGRPIDAVNRHKRKCLSRAAVGYLRKSKLQPDYVRFDVIEVIGQPGDRSPEIRHVENAFPLDSGYRLWW